MGYRILLALFVAAVMTTGFVNQSFALIITGDPRFSGESHTANSVFFSAPGPIHPNGRCLVRFIQSTGSGANHDGWVQLFGNLGRSVQYNNANSSLFELLLSESGASKLRAGMQFVIPLFTNDSGVAAANVTLTITAADLAVGNTAFQNNCVDAAAVLGFSKTFTPDTITPGGISKLIYTITNTEANAASSLAFTDNLPAGVVVATPANVINLCNTGAVTAADGSGTITYTGGTLAAAATCNISVDVTSTTPGSHVSTSGDLTSVLGNSGTATDTLTVTSTGPTAEETQKVIAEFMLNRANNILANQPRIIGFVDGSNASRGGPLGNLAINGNSDSIEVAFATSRSKILASVAKKRIEQVFREQGHTEDGSTAEPTHALAYADGLEPPSRAGTWDIWTEVHGARSDNGTSDSDFWVGYVGLHTFIDDNTLIGVLGQIDWADETNSTIGSNADGQGWMIGPYIAGQVKGKNLFYEARASWGQSSNTVSPVGTYRDSFDTTRWMASARINGAYDLGDVIMRPELQLSYFEETQESYTDSLATVIPEQTISLGELRFGPSFTRTIALDNGKTIQPMIGISGVWNFGIEDNSASQGFVLGNDDLRARLDGGLSASNDLGWILALTGFYDGIGINDYNSYGASVRLTIPLN